MMNTVGADEVIIEARVTPDMPVALNLWNLQSVTQGSREPHLEWAKRLSPPLEGQLFFGELAPWVHVMLANVAAKHFSNASSLQIGRDATSSLARLELRVKTGRLHTPQSMSTVMARRRCMERVKTVAVLCSSATQWS